MSNSTLSPKFIGEYTKSFDRDVKISTKEPGCDVAVIVDGMIALKATSKGTKLYLAMLPDIFTFSDWHGIVDTRSVKVQLKCEHNLDVMFTTQPTTLEEVLDVCKTAFADINLYGYTIEV